ncbi:MAG: UDP-N-acetylmuramoyl-L-alanyl-D-glutamate--2,6-diaminopimelate ligase [Parvularculaceae bacterium]|nr:UDP-N-acetylmuramoyl-L-alanyl-D-glutamate--2,6-diaminopimelate ligase [Parvularculaceae bacterium]
MKLSALAATPCEPDPEIKGITADSRAVGEGFLFAAIAGTLSDGATYIPQAEEAGAAAILARPGVKTRLPLIADIEPRRRLSEMASRFFPRQPRLIAGVTGTNGKTSSAVFTRALWEMLGENAGFIGTLGAKSTNFEKQLIHTTPDPVTLHETLDAMAASGAEFLCMEASSHALAQHRADAVRFSIAAFTNITQDHLDYHSGFDEYFRAKLKLFLEIVPDDATAVVNMDGAGADEVARASKTRGLRLVSTGRRGETIRITSVGARPFGLDVQVECEGKTCSLTLPLIGAFQAENALLAAGIVVAGGEPAARVLPLLEKLPGVPGRMQHAADVGGAGVYVDYAHTPDAIATALAAIRPHAEGRVIAIIGAGGDRDRGKRALMGAAAQAGADHVIVTDDNPRTEDPRAIRRDILSGCPGAQEIGDRGEAVAAAVAMLKKGDVLLIAGKGHETGQIVGKDILPFDDVDVARRAAREVGR